MTGEIVSFECFLAMETQNPFSFDIILGTCIGKSEMGKRSSVLGFEAEWILTHCQ